MEEIKLSARYKKYNKFEDVNDIDPDFIEEVLFKMRDIIGFVVRTVAKPEKAFNEEPLVAIKALIEYKEKGFSISIERTTYDNSFLLNVTITVDNEEELFASLYDIKVEIVMFLKQYIGEVYYLQDTSNQKICTDLYKRVHDIENDFRQLITLFFIRKIGQYDLPKNLKDSANDYSSWYNSKYKTSPFRRIESPLFNLNTERLFEVLERHMFDLESDEKQRLTESVDKLNELLDDLNWASEFTISTIKLNDFRKKFDREFVKYKDKTIFELYFKESLKEDFKDKWKEFSKMRNMVAHNKPICKELYTDILKACEELTEKINSAKENMDHFIPEEVIMVDALYEHQREELEAELNEVEYIREMSGLNPIWDEDTVIEKLGYTKGIEELLSYIDNYRTVKSLMEDYNETYSEIEEMVNSLDLEKAKSLKKRIEEVFEIEIEVDDDLDEEDTLNDTIAGIMKALNDNILDIENVYSDLDDSKTLDCFSMDESLAEFKDLEGNEYSIYMDGSINPDNNYEEDIEVHLKKNKDIIKKGYININYGGYDCYDYYENQADNPYEADITPRLDDFNEDIDSIIQGIISSMQSKFDKLEEIEGYIKGLK